MLATLAIALSAALPHPLPGLSLNATARYTAGLLKVTSPVGDCSVFHAHVEHEDKSTPLIAWMNGGPGASSLMGFFTELGPTLLNLQSVPATGAFSLDASDGWRPFSNPHAWSRLGSLLVWEQPAGVGFSRCLGGCPRVWNDTTSALANLATLRAFYASQPAEASRSLVLAGESYGGIYVPLLAQLVLRDASLRARGVALASIAVGNGCVGYGVEGGCGLDSLDIFVSTLERLAPGVSRAAIATVRSKCTPAELRTGRQPGQLSRGCAAAVSALFVEVGEYNQYHWSSPCGPDGQGNWGDGSAFACATGVLPRYLALPATQRALGVILPGEPPLAWESWDGDSPYYHITEADAQPAYRDLLAAGVPTLIYSGLADTGVPDVGAERWVPRVAGAAQTEPRRKWGAPPRYEFAGHVETYASGLTFATVAGAGHLVPADRPAAALAMVGAWVKGERLPAYKGAACKRLWLGRHYADWCDSPPQQPAAVAPGAHYHPRIAA